MGKGRGRPVGCQVGVRDCEGVSLGREGVAFWQMGLKLDKLHFSPEPKMGKPEPAISSTRPPNFCKVLCSVWVVPLDDLPHLPGKLWPASIPQQLLHP
eukprot:1146996-Pelagomonas_calceolata.AAC.2